MKYDVAIIGGGVAGMTAGIYAVRNGLSAVLYERKTIGGQIALTNEIENYPAVQSISGYELASNMEEQAKRLGVKILYDEVLSLELDSPIKRIQTKRDTAEADYVILAMGADPRMLGLEKEREYIGKGISYCAVCDAAFYRNKVAAVIGGGNTAVQDALHLAKFAKKVYLVHRREEFRADKIETEKLKGAENIECRMSMRPVEIIGDGKIRGLVAEHTETGERETLHVDGIFLAIGYTPNTVLVQDKIKLSDYGYILTDAHMHTNLTGVSAAGDIVEKPLRQLITAENDGAIAASFLGERVK